MSRKLLPTKKCLSELVLFFSVLPLFGGSPTETASELKSVGFDPARCYRVRDFSLIRDDLKLFLTDGYLILSKPVAGRPIGAFFSTGVEGGDAEVLLLPPDQAERASLARFTASPNLNQHFQGALLLFTDGTAAELEEMIRSRQIQPVPEMGALMESQWSSALRSLTTSFEIRLLADIASEVRPDHGLFFAALTGTALGNFDVIHDPRRGGEITAGQLKTRENRTYYDIWTSFRSRRARRLGPAGSALDFGVEHVSIDAALDVNLRMHATTNIRIQMPPAGERKGDGRVLAFDISHRMQVTGASIDGKPATVFQRDTLRSDLLRQENNGVFLLGAGEPLSPGPHEVIVKHEGDVINAAGNGVFSVSARGTWYPYHGSQFATYDLTFRHPRHLTVVSSGERIDSKAAVGAGDQQVTRHRSTTPLRFVGFNLGEYRHQSITRGALTVEVYANKSVEPALAPRRSELLLPPAMPQGGRIPGRRAMEPLVITSPPPLPAPANSLNRIAEEVGDTLQFLTSVFGPPPLTTLAVSPIPGLFGQGFPGLIYLSTLSYLDPPDRPGPASTPEQRIFFSDILVAHEVAHQWWGNQVVSYGYEDEWLMEALANYSALMLVEKRRGTKVLDEILEAYRQRLITKTDQGQTLESTGPIRFGQRLATSDAPQAWRTIIYEKGSWILHMLRHRLGDKAWMTLLSELNSEFRRKNLTTSEFLARAAHLLPAGDPDPKLENFGATWIAGTGIPALKLVTTSRPGALVLEGQMEQSNVPEEFSVDVPLEVQLRNGKSELRWIRTDGARTTFRWRLPAPLSKVVVDARNAVLATKGR